MIKVESHDATTAAAVKRANRELYDAVAEDYERIDGRRTSELQQWIRARLLELAAEHGNGVLLDLGSGTGIVTRAAEGIFAETIALDLSPRILAVMPDIAMYRIVADVDALPFATASVDVVTSFAVLHHLYTTDRLAREIARVLRPGGGYWSDHDMDIQFRRRFALPLRVYRRIRAAGQRYSFATGSGDHSTYSDAEVHEDGVDADRVLRDMRESGLSVRSSFHWYGLSPWANRLFGKAERPRRWAPLLRIHGRRNGVMTN